jgi:hypothetical protein
VPIQIFPKWNAKKMLPVNSLVPEPNFIEIFVRPLHQAREGGGACQRQVVFD